MENLRKVKCCFNCKHAWVYYEDYNTEPKYYCNQVCEKPEHGQFPKNPAEEAEWEKWQSNHEVSQDKVCDNHQDESEVKT